MEQSNVKSIFYLKKFSDRINKTKDKLYQNYIKGLMSISDFNQAIDTLLNFEKTLIIKFNSCCLLDGIVNNLVVNETLEFLKNKLFLFEHIYNLPKE